MKPELRSSTANHICAFTFLAKGQWCLYALASAIMLVMAAVPPLAQSQTLTVLHSFKGPPGDGQQPQATLVLDPAGNLFGATPYGGDFTYYGTVFKVDPTGKETVLHSFTGRADGGYPFAGLIRDPTGNLYGTAKGGVPAGFGALFKVAASGRITVLYAFSGAPDGYLPQGTLIGSAKGSLYGTTATGGDVSCGNLDGCGTVFERGARGKVTTLFRFPGGSGGYFPLYGAVRDAAGNLYGTTSGGGDLSCSGTTDAFGCGTVFKLLTTGRQIVLHRFSGGMDGGNSFGGVIRDEAGNLYGTTVFGGDLTCKIWPDWLGCGNVFKLDRTGRETVVYTFKGGTDGAAPWGGVIRDEEGNLYGVTAFGGDITCGDGLGCGTVFKVDSTGRKTVLYSFTGLDGAGPSAGVIRDTAGNLYGTTQGGGDFGLGTVFKLAP